MTCEEARELMGSGRRGRGSPEDAAALEEHLAGCAACRHEAAAERALTDALLRARRPAPEGLKRRLEAVTMGGDPPYPPAPPALARPARPRAWAPTAAAAALGIALAAGVALYYERTVVPRALTASAVARLDQEAVNDHLRILASEHPLDVPSGGIHQVKPWFAGRLDFAPVVAFEGSDEFPLQGGAVGWLLDRKAAVFVYKRRLHTISLLVFRAEGLDLPATGPVPLGRLHGRASRVRGYNLLVWRDGELGYALVSDVDASELATLGAKIVP